MSGVDPLQYLIDRGYRDDAKTLRCDAAHQISDNEMTAIMILTMNKGYVLQRDPGKWQAPKGKCTCDQCKRGKGL